MNHGICLQSFIPVRFSPSEKSEMTNQLLFGETFSVTEQASTFIKIRCSFDGYVGWIDPAGAHGISEDLYNNLNELPQVILDRKLLLLTLEDKSKLTILPGSVLPYYQSGMKIFEIDKITFRCDEKPEIGKESPSAESILLTARAFLNVPYLWGGRSFFGTDCSGFTQVVFKINHIKIPRDTRQQVFSGKPVLSIEDAQAGDLAFFTNEEGKISHVGILTAQNQIIHASGHVRADQLDSKGIFMAEKGKYSHRLECLRRLL